MAVIPTAPIDRLIRNTGATRVSEAASKKMVEALEDYTNEVARKASDIAKHSGRKTVKAEDIKLALRQ